MDVMREIIIDTDVGTDIDDVYAIAMAIKAGGLNVIGVSTVSGNALGRARIAKDLVVQGGAAGIPVFSGLGGGTRRKTSLVYGRAIAGESTAGVNESLDDMLSFYWKSIDSSKTLMTIVTIGPLSNMKYIRDHDPSKFDESVELISMCGAINRSYLSSLKAIPEYNIFKDIKSAREIIASNVKITLLPLDATMNLKMDRDLLGMLDRAAPSDPLLDRTLALTRQFKRRSTGKRPIILFDPATIAFLIDESIFQSVDVPLKVTRFGFTRKAREDNSITRPIKTCMGSNKERFFQLFRDIIGIGTGR
ncbi:MAG: nucleoside hydrolase [Promethearchaeota archaeon]